MASVSTVREKPFPAKGDAAKKKSGTGNKKEKVVLPLWKRYFSQAMVFLAVMFHAFGVIQATEIYTTQNASGVSLPAYIVYVFAACTWFVYGGFVLPERNTIIMASAITQFCLGVIILVGIALYRNPM